MPKNLPRRPRRRAEKNVGERDHLGNHGGRTHETKAHQRPAPPERADAQTDVGASDGIESVVDTVRFQCAREAIDGPGPIVDGRGAQ